MVNGADSSAERLLDAFFGPANEVDRTAKLDPWVERLKSGATTVLPVATPDDRLLLYGISTSTAAARGLAEELLAAIGPSWSDFEGVPAELDPDDAIEGALLGYRESVGNGPTYRLEVRDRPSAWAAMERLRKTWERRPPPQDDVLATFPDLLRDVELALQTPAIEEAARLIETLRRRGELSSQNLLFLELRLLAAGARWEEILRHPRLDDVLQAHRPTGVTLMLLQAIDASLLQPSVKAGDAQTALAVYREKVADRFAAVLNSAPTTDDPAALQLRALAWVDEGRSRADVLAVAAEAGPDVRPWIEAIALLAEEAPHDQKPDTPEAPAEDALEIARAAAYAGDHHRVLEGLAAVPATRQTLELLVGAAVGVRSLAAARAVAAAYGTLAPAEQEALENLPLLAPALEKILAIAGDGQGVQSWRQWLARISADEPYGAAVEVAELGATEWPASEPATPDEAKSMAAEIIAVPYQGRTALERAVPHLLGYLDRRTQTADLALPVYGAILDVLAYGDSRSRAVREATVAVLGRLLAGAPPIDQYEEYVTLIEHMWEDGIRAPTTVGWLADVLVAVTHHPSPSQSARISLMRRALHEAATWRDLDQLDVDLLRVLAKDPIYGDEFRAEVDALPEAQTVAPEEEGTAGPARPATPLVIGIYSLSEPASQRAKAVLERRFPQHDVQLNHEHDDSDRLRGLARRADVMAVVIASAKHAATDAIRRQVSDSALLEVGTSGSTGLLRAILGRLEEIAVA